MKRTPVVATLAALTIVMTAAVAAAQPAVAPPAAPTTLWSFMGIPQGINKVNGALFNRRGNHPFLEKKPPLKSIADPANLASENPAIKRAAQVKQEEDLKPQKIKAIKYLAEIGCGCYDKDGSITKAMVAAMDDCTEDVRLAAVEAINTAGSGEQCENCKQKSCCNEVVVKKLAEIVYERDEHGCYKEPSERVRKAAEEAMCACCTGRGPLVIENATPEPQQGEPRPDVPADVPPPPAQARQSELRDARFVSSRRTAHLYAAAGDRAEAPADPSRDATRRSPSVVGWSDDPCGRRESASPGGAPRFADLARGHPARGVRCDRRTASAGRAGSPGTPAREPGGAACQRPGPRQYRAWHDRSLCQAGLTDPAT